MRRCLAFAVLSLVTGVAGAQTTQLALSNNDFVVTPLFNNVPLFSFEVEINLPLEAGVYDNPPLARVRYTVEGELANTPSGFPRFALERDIDGAEFYAQGSSLRFEIDSNAVLDDGVQIAELRGASVVFVFDGREIDNGRFHPAILELRADGTGRLQNSNNVVSENPPLEVGFGDEYVTDLRFDPGNLTLLTTELPPPDRPPFAPDGGGALAAELLALAAVIGLSTALRYRRRRRR